MSDDPNLSELLDDDKLPPVYPPDPPSGVLEDELTVRGQETDEPLEERVLREEPDFPMAMSPDDEPVGTLVGPEGGEGPVLTKENVAYAVDPGLAGDDQLDAGDFASGDITTGDVATERVGELPAEEAAVHLTDDPPMGDGDGYV